MANRIDNQLCVACGNPLLYPFNEFRTCTRCTEIIKRAQYNAKKDSEMGRIRKDKRRTSLNVKRSPIFVATRPIGEEVL